MRVLPAKNVEEALNILAKEAEVFVPMAKGQMTGFFRWENDPDDELVLEAINTYLSPKNIVIPQTEKMYWFTTEGQDVRIQDIKPDDKERIIFGIRACDIKGIEALDMVFLTRGYVDEFYKSKREQVTMIARACYQPGNACFCESMDVDRLQPAGDVVMHELENGDYLWEPKTEKGERITTAIQHLFQEREADLPSPKEQKKRVDTEGLPEKLKGMFEAPVWEELSSRCMNCGICTNVCPTCYCFDIQVKVWGDEGYRFRCWDSCMYKEYTQMAGGHNPRPDKKERFRNRFLHKLEFFVERYGTYLCTGCGRCVVLCPNQVNIIEIIGKLKEVAESV